MFIFNLNLNKNIFIFLLIIAIFVFGIVIYKVVTNTFSDKVTVNDSIPEPDVIDVTSSNYTNVLKAVHDNLSQYEGKKVHFAGYVYRVYDFEKEQFVLARDMIISSDLQTLVVGFLCHYNNALNFADKTWVEITGEITSGDYHGDIPIIEIKQIKQIEKPSDEYVYPPDSSYVPTNAWI